MSRQKREARQARRSQERAIATADGEYAHAADLDQVFRVMLYLSEIGLVNLEQYIMEHFKWAKYAAYAIFAGIGLGFTSLAVYLLGWIGLVNAAVITYMVLVGVTLALMAWEERKEMLVIWRCFLGRRAVYYRAMAEGRRWAWFRRPLFSRRAVIVHTPWTSVRYGMMLYAYRRFGWGIVVAKTFGVMYARLLFAPVTLAIRHVRKSPQPAAAG